METSKSLNDIFKRKKAVYSFEIFPPKKTDGIALVYRAIDQIKTLEPDFISVTYGAGGSETNLFNIELARYIGDQCGIASTAHLTCINSTKAQVANMIDILKKNGIKNILALRGDRVEGITPPSDFRYAVELIEYIRSIDDSFYITAACYPEGHTECESMEKDIEHLKQKVDAGVKHLISQLFFDNEKFYDFMDKIQQKGIDLPVEAGIMPVLNKKQIHRMTTLCGASIPKKFQRIMDRYEDDPVALRDAGIAYATEQIIDLLSNGVRGIHLYTMNNPLVAIKITQAIRTILTNINR